jgi:hypothetical protein
MLEATDQPACGLAPAKPEVKTIEPPGRIWLCAYLAAVKAPQ